jgi:poly-gamma-glutamate capsule biosynthesis protein CapA/YwtB (metallophosphatase superfamily)
VSDKNSITLVAAGDFGPLPFREHPEEIFDLTRSIFKKADIAFLQLEKNLTERGTIQLQVPRSIARTRPIVAKAMADAGIKIVSFASNHTLAFSNEGLFDTLDNLAKNNITVIGAGRNIKEAKKPAIFDIRGTKIGFVGYCSAIPKGFEAWEDKPGLNPIKVSTHYEQVDWAPGTPPKTITKADPADLAAMIDDIKKLRPLVDVLIVSQHWGVHYVPSIIAGYQYEVGHAAIDAGADLIIGHHAHILKGIEIYKGKVIFFSMGNFMMDHPHSLMSGSVLGHLREAFGWDPDPDYPNYAFPRDAQKAMMVRCTIADKKIQRVAFLPTWINKLGQPEPLPASDPRSDKVKEYMEWVIKDQWLNGKFHRDGDEFVVPTE